MGSCCITPPRDEPVAKYQARENTFRKVNMGPDFKIERRDSLG